MPPFPGIDERMSRECCQVGMVALLATLWRARCTMHNSSNYLGATSVCGAKGHVLAGALHSTTVQVGTQCHRATFLSLLRFPSAG